MDEIRRLSDFEIGERAAEAQDMLNDTVLGQALDSIHSRALGTLLAADIGSLTASTAHATMKAISDLRSQLQQYVNDNKMRLKYPKQGNRSDG